MSHKFITVSGYCDPQHCSVIPDMTFFQTWLDNVRKVDFYRAYIVNAGGTRPNAYTPDFEWINVDNLGHIRNMPKHQRLSGWSAAFMTGLLLAYQRRSDMIFFEGDCLAFGPWVDMLYDEIGDKGMITGKPNGEGPACSLIGQSLVLVKNRFLLDFLSIFTGIQSSDADEYSCPERKFSMIAKNTGEIVQTSLGYDRTRPIGYDDRAFYAQQLVDSELAELTKRRLI